ncbi:hypothetical protein CDAR_402271, partial [Caerostris darwini]
DTCSNCGSTEHVLEQCISPAKCVNCSGDHPSNARICPQWTIEKQIQTVKARDNLSYFEAKKKCSPVQKSYASILNSTVSQGTQTDEQSQNEEAPSREFSKLSFRSVATVSACAIKPKPTTGSASQSRPPALNSSPSPLSHTRPNPIPVNNKFSSLGRRKSLTRQGKGIEKPKKPKNTKEKLLNSLDHKDSSASKTSDEDAMVININPCERISDVEST